MRFLWPQDGRGEPTVLEEQHGNLVSSLAMLPDGRLASASVDGAVRLYLTGTRLRERANN
jgi:hypothetical protein